MGGGELRDGQPAAEAGEEDIAGLGERRDRVERRHDPGVGAGDAPAVRQADRAGTGDARGARQHTSVDGGGHRGDLGD